MARKPFHPAAALLVALLAWMPVAGATEAEQAPEPSADTTDRSAPVADSAPPADAVPAAAAPATPAPVTASDLAGYLAALQAHVERDPALAAAYTVFWSELRETTRAGRAMAEVAPATFGAMARTGQDVVRAVQQHYRGVPPSYATAEALRIAIATLAQERADPAAGATRAERLLANLDRAVAPRVTVDGRYEFTGDLQRPADLGFGAEVWLLCRTSNACVEAHDTLFASAMAGIGLVDTLETRLSRDALVAALPQVTALREAAQSLDARLAQAADPQALKDVAGLAARDYFRAITAGIPLTPGSAPGTAPTGVDGTTDLYGLDALFTLGRAGAYLAGQETLANLFTVTRTPVLDFATTLTQGALLGTLASSAAGAGLLFAGVQALALFDGVLDGQRGTAPAELRQLVISLNDTTYRGLQSARAEQLLATNAVDTRVAALGIALDVVKTDVARLETAARRRIGSDYQAATARRWTAFDEDNERCFSLRNRDPRSGLLRPAEFRRCEDRFLQGAVRRSQYGTRATEYVLDARFIAPGDPRFPFHDHYPLLATLGGIESRAALALPDPLEWQQHAAALLRLYQENPAGAAERHKRQETLVSLRDAGARTHRALQGLVVREAPDGTQRFREDLHRKALDDYFDALRRVVVRVGALDDPATHPYGKRLTEGLGQPRPQGQKRAAMEAALSDAAQGGRILKSCSDADPEAFLPQPDRLLAESRRFFGSPIRPEELAAAWNRTVVDGLALTPASYSDLVPVEYLWAALDGLGAVEFCLTRFRPEAVAFTRDRGPARDTLLGTTLVGAELEVRFRASPEVAAAAGLPGEGTVTVARYAAERACTFGYRNDDEPCSRAECLQALAPLLWSGVTRDVVGGAQCDGGTLTEQLPQRNALAADASLDALRSALEQQYRVTQAEARARLEADVLRSNEYEQAAAQYLKYYALAGLTLGTYPDGADELGGLFGPSDALTPRAIVAALIDERLAPSDVLARLETRSAQVSAAVAARARELEGTGTPPRFVHLRGIEETLARIDLAASAYAGG